MRVLVSRSGRVRGSQNRKQGKGTARTPIARQAVKDGERPIYQPILFGHTRLDPETVCFLDS